MLVVGFLYFLVDSMLKKYLLMYVFVTKIESGGAFWRLLFNRFLFAMMLSNLIVGIVVWVQYDGSNAWAWIIPLPLALIGFKIYCRRKFDDQMHYNTKPNERDSIIAGAGLPKLASRRSEKLRTRFGHPALYRPLIHPMVRADAQRIFAEVYRGRTNSDVGNRSTVYGEIDLDAMESGRPGKRLGGDQDTGGVQFVEDRDMDFSKWKHKPGFAEDGAEVLSLRGSTYGSGWITPGGLQGLDSARSSLEGDIGFRGMQLGKRHDFGSGSRPHSPLSTGFAPAGQGGTQQAQGGYHGVPGYSSPVASRATSPNPQTTLHPHQQYQQTQPQGPYFQPPSREPSPLHMYPPHSPGGGMLAPVDTFSDAHSVHSHMSGDSMRENLLARGAFDMPSHQSDGQGHQFPAQAYQGQSSYDSYRKRGD